MMVWMKTYDYKHLPKTGRPVKMLREKRVRTTFIGHFPVRSSRKKTILRSLYPEWDFFTLEEWRTCRG